ncbi:ATP-dependent DNA helicase RecQ [Clostridium novyi]|uniref:DEAD/DEAH box helicase n=1 Tax=Clostridium novyi TaxID=1542 RepID=UPI000EA02FD6|nr:DEAD/DEAH box helicase [Clostridium novyi]AYF55171.1 ATP-dependent DNA helicase RecQ [Clostridium novyi]
MKFNDIYLKAINEVFDNISNEKNVCLFFKGFNAEFFSALSSIKTNRISNSVYLNHNHSINLQLLEKNKNLLLIKFLQQTEGISWGYYEELIALCNTWNDIEKQENIKIIVVNNNLFNNSYPLTLDEKLQKRLANYVNNEEKEDLELEVLMNYYSDVIIHSDRTYGIVYKDSNTSFTKVNIYKEEEPVISTDDNASSNIVTQLNLFEIKARLQNGEKIEELNFVINNKQEARNLYSFVYIMNELNVKYSITFKDRFSSEDNIDDNKYLSILKKYWGKDKEFRKINFYKNPDESNEVIEISQGHIISYIINQINIAIDNKENFRDVFITAPTGSGKSLLFQIPAIYSATESKIKAVTIVITPLIALMRDQVEQLKEKMGIEFATFLNSEISFEEKESRIRKIKNGEISIVYMSPELLLGSSLENIIGSRTIALLVVDEAHIVTTWGRDFRADYWFLGTYIEKIRRNKEKKFPIVCLTATAVYMGSEDTVNDTITTLSLNTPKIYLGNVRRNNINFDINFIERKSIKGGFEEFKLSKTHERIIQLITKKRKSIVYCPFTTHIQQISDLIESKVKNKIGIYYGAYDKIKKIESQKKFKNGDNKIMLCTKAFGMGIDIRDIETVYHYAPTGNLSDYVQEIGRVARDENIKGCAATDFTESDLKYVRMLSSLSSIKQYQLKEVLRKLYNIYKEKRKRNILISPETFSYLFGNNNLENRVKTSLLLLEKDLNRHFNVLIVRPKSMFTKNFVNVPFEVKDIFIKKYGKYSKEIKENTKRIIPGCYRNGDIEISNTGTIYEVNMSELWENNFSNLTFPDFKRRFFNGELFELDNDKCKLSPRVHLIITYRKDYEECKILLKDYCNKLSSIFSYFKHQNKFFTKTEFKKVFKSKFYDTFATQDLSDIILNMFIADISENIGFNQNKDKYRFIQQRKSQTNDMELEYRIMNNNYSTFGNYLIRQITQCVPKGSDNIHSSYIAICRGEHKTDMLQLSILLELFGLATYEVIGGKNIEIFVRINDPLKIKKLSNVNYRNNILTQIEDKRRKSQDILQKFMSSKLSDEERWDVIENYFLGNDEYVNHKLGIL